MPFLPALSPATLCHSRVGGNLDTCFRRYDIKLKQGQHKTGLLRRH
ncbi:hypothetical protein [Candidatus Tisiphia endosymbiont of Hybos culiciformis]